MKSPTRMIFSLFLTLICLSFISLFILSKSIESNRTNNRVMPKKYEVINESNNAKISRFSERDDGMTRASNQTVDEIINKFVNITNSVNKVLRKPPKLLAKKKKFLRTHYNQRKISIQLPPVTRPAPKITPPSQPIQSFSRNTNGKKSKTIDVKPWPPIKIPSPRGTNQILIIDAFTFNFELDLLEIRLNELKHVVDYHILVESVHDLYGSVKRLYFDEHKHEKRFLKYRNKIIHVPIREWPENKTGML